uniref:Uncharacterized protein n=1 Tax=Nothobranchius rachovii TaxID=451742 RepID=A0A1A8RYP1_9TELE
MAKKHAEELERVKREVQQAVAIICGSSLIKRLADKPPMQQLTRSLSFCVPQLLLCPVNACFRKLVK